ncbi:MAG: sulfate adenylyltransferase [Thermoplasmata archaeon]|nr:sulfate adenylyltransferase [Thermoplasmata archaeon]
MPPPHGGRLVNRELSRSELARREGELAKLPRLRPEVDQLLDVEKIAVGAYSPLEGFMDRRTLDGVLESSRLPNSVAWTIPIVLTPPGPANRRVIDGLGVGDEVALLDEREQPVALLRLREKYAFDRGKVARNTYGTRDPAHPNVADLQRTGETALAGAIELLARRPSPYGAYELTPAEMRAAFARRHWTSVAAYQTRNVPHRAHEHIQKLTLEREDIDGLLIHPVVGRLKLGDYRPDVVLRCYEALIGHYFPADRILLATLSIAMRYAGPKAALFLAIVRKNFGCSHYIVGRDQAGVGQFYDPYESHRIFDELPVGITPIRYREAFYCRACGGVESFKTCPHPEGRRLLTSQTLIRGAIRSGQPIPPELVRPEVRAILAEGNVVLEDDPNHLRGRPSTQVEESREARRTAAVPFPATATPAR